MEGIFVAKLNYEKLILFDKMNAQTDQGKVCPVHQDSFD